MGIEEKPQMVKVNFKLQPKKVLELAEFFWEYKDVFAIHLWYGSIQFKHAFMVFFRVNVGFIISKEGKLPNKIQAILNMHGAHNSLHIQVFNGMA